MRVSRGAYFEANEGLPPEVREGLPGPAQDLWRRVYNVVSRSPRKERMAPDLLDERCAAIAWTVVRRRFRQVGDRWVRLADMQAEEVVDNAAEG